MAPPSNTMAPPNRASNINASDPPPQGVSASSNSNAPDHQQGLEKIAARPSSSRGPSFSKIEDLLVCKAFIRRSEDPITGNSQKGKDFMIGMRKDYKELLATQFRLDSRAYGSSSEATREAFGGQVPIPYLERTPISIFGRFKETIAPRVMKFLGIQDTLPKESGTNDEDFYQACKTVFSNRFPRFGNFDDMRTCKEYLEDKAKFSSFRTKLKAAESEKKNKGEERPCGSKKAKQASKDVKLIKEAISQYQGANLLRAEPGSSGTMSTITIGSGQGRTPIEDGKASFFGKAGALMDRLGSALANHYESENNKTLLEKLTTPQRTAWNNEQFEIQMAEAKLKRRKLEASLARTVVSSAAIDLSAIDADSVNGDSNSHHI